MLNIFYGDMEGAVYNTSAYFKYDYEDSWITDPFVKEMIQAVDESTVLDSGVIDSPVLGKIPPTGLSGGVKTLILVKFDKDKVFNASTCSDNCAEWLLKIAETFWNKWKKYNWIGRKIEVIGKEKVRNQYGDGVTEFLAQAIRRFYKQ